MSDRTVGMRVRVSKRRIGRQLVVREGKGSRLTDFAEDLMKQSRRLQSVVEAETGKVFDTLFSGRLEGD